MEGRRKSTSGLRMRHQAEGGDPSCGRLDVGKLRSNAPAAGALCRGKRKAIQASPWEAGLGRGSRGEGWRRSAVEADARGVQFVGRHGDPNGHINGLYCFGSGAADLARACRLTPPRVWQIIAAGRTSVRRPAGT